MSISKALELPQHPGNEFHYGQLYGLAKARLIAQASAQAGKFILLIVDNDGRAEQLQAELEFFGLNANFMQLPSLETLPYDVFSAHPDIISARLNCLYQLRHARQGILLISAAGLLQRLAPVSYIDSKVMSLTVGAVTSIAACSRQLQQLAYCAVPQVSNHGEFAVRGSLLDVFPMGSSSAVRIDFFDDTIESMRYFAIDSQLSHANCTELKILPAHEFDLDAAGISLFRQNFRQRFSGDPQNAQLYRDISQGIASAGIEYYLPLFFAELATIFDYLPANSLIIDHGSAECANFLQTVAARYEQRRHNSERPILSPAELYLSASELQAQLARWPIIKIHNYQQEATASKRVCNFASQSLPPVSINVQHAEPALLLQNFCAQQQGKILFIAHSSGREQVLRDLLQSININAVSVQNWQQALSSSAQFLLGTANIDQGMLCTDICIISETQIYGEHRSRAHRQRVSSKSRDAHLIISSLQDLHIGAAVVHEQQGVGRYQGLQTLEIDGNKHEFLMLSYADNDKLYVPVSDLELISRYSGAADEAAPLHKLGSDRWLKQKQRAAKQARDVAAELLALNAKRHSKTGHAFALPSSQYQLFCSGFLFSETPDQQDAIDAVLNDMCAEQPMDRVICGDVGFGKTEVAMRAAFVAAYGHKQVCILAPTTLLVQQHFDNFSDRFGSWALNVAQLSRFVSAKQQQATIDKLQSGEIDIIIGTHKLLGKDIKFKNLGLVIVDEEQRFGVRHKEALKRLRAEVDILTLTATPIPRTLNMAMAGLRALSIIATPPKLRMAVKTFVSEWDEPTISEACQREFARGGQVYFVHNEIKSIARMRAMLQAMLPAAKIDIAHGQLQERELEQIMLNFYHRHSDILLCTTIIESGIDVANANTIIINQAHKFGLAQLHQMRGRVGRSHHRAYAYLLAPPATLLSADAKKRLEAIESLEELGAGFTLATHDLEIRGAGELLGAEQSGQIQEVGFTLYNEMLRRAVQALKNGDEFDTQLSMDSGVDVNLGLCALLADDYVPDVHNRLILYKRLASKTSAAAIDKFSAELLDRFGALPESATNLLQIAKLKLHAQQVGATLIHVSKHYGKFEFAAVNKIDHGKLLATLQRQPTVFKIEHNNTLKFKHQLEADHSRIDFIWQTLAAICELD